MTTGRGRRSAAARVTAALLAACGMLALAACDQRPEPRPAYDAAPPPPPVPLAGDPDAAPSAVPPAASSQPEAPAPSLAPPDAAPPPQAAPGYGEGLVAMAPIPNPEDGGPAPPRSVSPHVRRTSAPAARPLSRSAHRHRHPRARPRPATAAARPATTASRPPVATVRRPHPAPPPAAALKPQPKAAAKPAVRSAPHHERRATPAELRQAKHATPPVGAKAASNTTAADADARTEALRSALSAAVARGAVLSAPKGGADGASEVTLTLPAGFYDTVKTEAGRQTMGDAAASANADATLTGEGYAIIPGGAQAQPLRVGQPTLFRWTVTAPAGAKGPLRADVSVDLLGGGSQTLALGAVDQASAPGGAPRWWGAALLAAVVAIGFWWMLRTRSADARIAASRKRARRPDGTVNGQRPLDLRPTDDPPPR